MFCSRPPQTKRSVDPCLDLFSLNLHNLKKPFCSLAIRVLRQYLCLFLRVGSRALKLSKVNAEPR
jgi:hypothetical protein